MLKGIGVLIDVSFKGDRLRDLLEGTESGVAGDCDEGISVARIRRGVCGGGISVTGDGRRPTAFVLDNSPAVLLEDNVGRFVCDEFGTPNIEISSSSSGVDVKLHSICVRRCVWKDGVLSGSSPVVFLRLLLRFFACFS